MGWQQDQSLVSFPYRPSAQRQRSQQRAKGARGYGAPGESHHPVVYGAYDAKRAGGEIAVAFNIQKSLNKSAFYI